MNSNVTMLVEHVDVYAGRTFARSTRAIGFPDLTVFVVDGDRTIRRSLKQLLQSVGLAADVYATAEEFLRDYQPGTSGCMVLEAHLPGMSGLDLQDKLVELHATLPVIMMTGYANVATAVRAVKAGAIDFLEKPCCDQLLLESIYQAIEVSWQAHQLNAQRRDLVARAARLTPRERQVMDLVVVGKPNREIAAATGISPRTVEVHRANAMLKMGAHSQADLIRFALQCRTN